MKQIKLKPKKEQSLQRYHPWVFSGAIANVEGDPGIGDLVEVLNHKGQFNGMGIYDPGSSISVRMLSFKEKVEWSSYLKKTIDKAIRHRTNLGLFDRKSTNAFRLVHGEGDGLPGLIVDDYSGHIVIQCHTPAMHHHIQSITENLKSSLGVHYRSVTDKSADILKYKENVELDPPKEADILIWEHDLKYHVDIEQGQKTGFFLDQRTNRELIQKYSANRKVLNAFSYTGGFSLNALKGGASYVFSVDTSQKAIELADKNAQINAMGNRHIGVVGDVMAYQKEMENDFDLIVLDPPAYSKHKRTRHKAVQAYKRLNALALKKIAKGGILFTFSCSQVVDKALFENTIRAAAIEAGRNAVVLHHLRQPADHPVSIFHPEGGYLKGMVIKVD